MTNRPGWRRGAALGALAVIASVAGGLNARAQDDRDYMRVMGRPEVLAYPVAVSTQMSASARRKYPQIEKSSEEGVRRSFCATLRDSPDVIIGPFAASLSADKLCGPQEPLLALPFGRQVIVLYTAPGAPKLAVTREQLFRALVRELPANDTNAAEAGFKPNPYKRWRDISPDLPDIPIHILAPPRRALQWLTVEDLLMRPVCMGLPAMKVLVEIDEQSAEQHCLSRRTDPAVVYADGEKYNANPAIVPKGTDVALNERRAMLLMPDAMPAAIDGIVPDADSLNADRYPLARPILAVVKIKRLDTIPNLRTFIMELVSPAASGPTGYLTRYGMDVLPEAALRRSALKAQFARAEVAPPTEKRPAE